LKCKTLGEIFEKNLLIWHGNDPADSVKVVNSL